MRTHRQARLLDLSHRSVLVLLTLVATACTRNHHAEIVNAATTPLRDLNLVHAEVPAVLLEAQKEPYGVPADSSCAALEGSIRALDEVLGPDLDAPVTPSHPSLLERASNEAAKAAVGALRRTAEGVVPYRAWVRQLSGAERYSKQVAAAIAAGGVRRAFLKGLMVSKDCG